MSENQEIEQIENKLTERMLVAITMTEVVPSDENRRNNMFLSLDMNPEFSQFLDLNPETKLTFWTDHKEILRELAETQIKEAECAIATMGAAILAQPAEPSIIIARH